LRDASASFFRSGSTIRAIAAAAIHAPSPSAIVRRQAAGRDRALDMAVRHDAAPRPFGAVLLGTALGLLVAVAVGILLRSGSSYALTVYFLRADLFWLTTMAVALLITRIMPPLPAAAAWASAAAARPAVAAAVIAVCVAVAGLVGTYLVCHGFALSRDERMAEFDTIILRSGQLIAPLPTAWRPFAAAMEPEFRLPVPGDVAWVSSYLPGNAALRAFFDLLGGAALTGPALAGIAVVAVMAVARRLWPQSRDAALVAALLLATSPQLILTAMTAYAMTAHLALNLLWLWLFLKDRPLSRAGALAVGFLACGLHQVIFHPLFVAPFILQLLLERRWRLASLYALAYALFGIFWILYWQLVLSANGIAAPAGSGVGIAYFVTRIIELLLDFGGQNLAVMAKNLLRLVAWQNVLLVPLVALGIGAAWRAGGVLRSLILGIVLTAATIFLLLPYQGHGWGYRYFHGLLGSFALVAAQGWLVLTGGAAPSQRWAASSALAFGVAFSLVLLLPLRAYEAHRFIAPYAAAMAAIERTDADVVIVDSGGITFGIDFVRNDPLLRSRPKVMLLEALTPASLGELCTSYRVAVFAKDEAVAHDVPTYETPPTTREAELRPLLPQLCRATRS
jgi:hypothetical protein